MKEQIVGFENKLYTLKRVGNTVSIYQNTKSGINYLGRVVTQSIFERPENILKNFKATQPAPSTKVGF